MADISIGVQLMLIGMVTVFAILIIVIYGSKLLISIINRFPASGTVPTQGKDTPDGADIKILEAAVAQITGGTGHIVRITEV